MLDALEAHVVLGNRLPEALAAELHRAPVLLNSAGVETTRDPKGPTGEQHAAVEVAGDLLSSIGSRFPPDASTLGNMSPPCRGDPSPPEVARDQQQSSGPPDTSAGYETSTASEDDRLDDEDDAYAKPPVAAKSLEGDSSSVGTSAVAEDVAELLDRGADGSADEDVASTLGSRQVGSIVQYLHNGQLANSSPPSLPSAAPSATTISDLKQLAQIAARFAVTEVENAVHPYALLAFENYLRPTLKTIASFGALHVSFLGRVQPVSAFRASQATGLEARSRFHLSPIQQLSAQGDATALAIRTGIGNRLLRRPRPILELLGRFDPPAPSPCGCVPEDVVSEPQEIPIDRPLRVIPGLPSILVQTIVGVQPLVSVGNATAALYKSARPALRSLPVTTLPPPGEIDLTPSNLGVDIDPADARSQRWEKHRPRRFFLPGDEQAANQAGYLNSSAKEQSSIDNEAERSTTKTGLMHRLEDLAGGPLPLIESLSEHTPEAPLITSNDELGKLISSGWTPGKAMVRLRVQDSVVVLPQPETDQAETSSAPLATLFPESTIPRFVQDAHGRALDTLNPTALLHAIGHLCTDTTCSSCPAAPAMDSTSELLVPRVFRSPPSSAQLRSAFGEDAELLVDVIKFKSASVDASLGKQYEAYVAQAKSALRQGGFVAWNLMAWPPFKWQRLLLEDFLPDVLKELEAGLAVVDAEGDGDPFHPRPFSAMHETQGAAGAMMRIHSDADSDHAPALLSRYGDYEGGETIYPELLLASAGRGGSIDAFWPGRVLHGVTRVTSGHRSSHDTSQSVGFDLARYWAGEVQAMSDNLM
ncbi:hypothetical protein JCM8202v2_004516 [Rhodotorula sphaerocarpa]